MRVLIVAPKKCWLTRARSRACSTQLVTSLVADILACFALRGQHVTDFRRECNSRLCTTLHITGQLHIFDPRCRHSSSSAMRRAGSYQLSIIEQLLASATFAAMSKTKFRSLDPLPDHWVSRSPVSYPSASQAGLGC